MNFRSLGSRGRTLVPDRRTDFGRFRWIAEYVTLEFSWSIGIVTISRYYFRHFVYWFTQIGPLQSCCKRRKGGTWHTQAQRTRIWFWYCPIFALYTRWLMTKKVSDLNFSRILSFVNNWQFLRHLDFVDFRINDNFRIFLSQKWLDSLKVELFLVWGIL